ncbi:MAG: hypothetical protein R3B96_20380 [Pirellulaceae bacterium]
MPTSRDPTAYLAAKPMEILDPLLADNRPRTTWTLADLLDDLPQVEESDRSCMGEICSR